MTRKTAGAPEEVDVLFAERVNAGDAAGVAALYEADAVLVPPEGEQRGRAAIEEGMTFPVAAGLQLRMKIVKVVGAGADVAVLCNDWTGKAAGPDGAAIEMTGRAIEIVRRQTDGSWRFVVDDPYARG